MIKPYYENEYGVLYKGDCLEIMPALDTKVDLVLTDPPFGTTRCSWDSVIPFDDMWMILTSKAYNYTPIVLFGIEPFSSFLRCSNIKMYKYDWVWEKSQGVNFAQCNHMPLKNYEIISVFGDFGLSKNAKIQPVFNPQNLVEVNKPKKAKTTTEHRKCDNNKDHVQHFSNYPKQIVYCGSARGLHPTQKPVALLEYLIRTYSNENDLVLDFTAGSSSTAIACMNTNRKFIMIEKEEKYCEISAKRMEEHLNKMKSEFNDI